MDLHMLKQLLCLQRHEGCQSSRSAENKAVKTYGEVDNMETDQRASDCEKQVNSVVIIGKRWTECHGFTSGVSP